jgi:hypothetical protein
MADTQIEVTPQQKLFYEEQLEKIMAVEKYGPPLMPLEEAVAEGNRVTTLVKEDRERLSKTGIDLIYLDTIEGRAGAFAWSAAQQVTYVNTQESAAKKWAETKPVAEKVRKQLLKDLTRAGRKDENLTKTVLKIKAGSGNLDRVVDFLSMHRAGKDNMDLLRAINADLSLVDKSAELYSFLSVVYSEMTTDPEEMAKAQLIFCKAWIYLKEAIDEIYEAGQYAFDEEDPRHNLYYSDYHVRLGEAAAKAARERKSAQEKAALQETVA